MDAPFFRELRRGNNRAFEERLDANSRCVLRVRAQHVLYFASHALQCVLKNNQINTSVTDGRGEVAS